MSNRLNKELESELQPKRLQYAKEQIQALGIEITFEDHTRLEFMWKASLVRFFAYSGWFSGKTVIDGRGIANLLKQLQ